MSKHYFIAFDLGAESGRAILGILTDNEKLELKVIHRFPTGYLFIHKHYYWNVFRLYEEIILALRKCVDEEKIIPESVGVDTWGVDFGLIGKDGFVLRLPYCYRDSMTETSMPAFFEKMDREEIYKSTGIAMLKFNSLYQLYAMILAKDPILQTANKLLFMPDLMNYLLTGEARSEFTISTTSQLFNPVKMNWDENILKTLGLSPDLLQEVVKPGTIIGPLNQNICREIDVEGINVIAVTSHDTAAAIASVPAEGDDWAYISSGTWSLMGIENKEAIADRRSLLYNFTNEGGAGGTFRFLKNIMGLWILQECRRSWEKKMGQLKYSSIMNMAEKADPFMAIIDPDYPGFYNPLDMPAAIETFCRHSGQISPSGIGPIARMIMEGLALKYRMVLHQLELVTGKKIKVIHMIGGGIQNTLLNQFTANATGRLVVAGPVEATGTGNILIQAQGLGYLTDLNHIRRVVKNSFTLTEYIPEDTVIWDNAYKRFQKIASPI